MDAWVNDLILLKDGSRILVTNLETTLDMTHYLEGASPPGLCRLPIRITPSFIRVEDFSLRRGVRYIDKRGPSVKVAWPEKGDNPWHLLHLMVAEAIKECLSAVLYTTH